MAAGIAAFGERGISGVFGLENNELHRKLYLQDPNNQLVPLLQALLDLAPGVTYSPRRFPPPFNTFRVWSVSFEGIEKSVQGDTDTQADFSLLDSLPIFRGGITLDVTYRPLDDYKGFMVSDETWDFAAQTMSMIGNAFGQNPKCLYWSDGTQITNLASIVKIIPKIEFTQKQAFMADLPTEVEHGLIGQVNDGPLTCGAVGRWNRGLWPEECVLLTGLPAVRRWRFDGQMIFERGVKLAMNMYRDVLETGIEGYVTWNRLYRPYGTNGGFWDRVLLGESRRPLYPSGPLWQVVQ